MDKDEYDEDIVGTVTTAEMVAMRLYEYNQCKYGGISPGDQWHWIVNNQGYSRVLIMNRPYRHIHK